MADQPRYPEASGNAGMGPERREGMPRWAKVSLIIAALVVLLVVLTMFLFPGGDEGGHGPDRHASSGEPMPPVPSVVASAPGVQPARA